MKKIHVFTSIGLLCCIVAIAAHVTQYDTLCSILFIAAYFLAIKEISKYTSSYQFMVVFSSALLAGASLDYKNDQFPVFTLVLFLSSLGSIGRIVFFKTFNYTNFSWFEPILFALSIAGYIFSFTIENISLTARLLVCPVILLQAILGWGIVKDKSQLLSKSFEGYRVKIGERATEFELLDQDGNLVKLSSLRGRHLLLLFVRGDWCPGCHMMLRTYEKNREKFAEKNVMILAIGPDEVGVNREMVEKIGLDFKVLSDEKQKTAMVYGVQLKEYENKFADSYNEGIPLPASFLIDKEGIVRYVSRPDKVGEFLNPSLIFPIVEKLN